MRDREGVRRGVRRRARGSARQSTSTKVRGDVCRSQEVREGRDDCERGRESQEERENEGIATLFDEMVAVAVQAVLSIV